MSTSALSLRRSCLLIPLQLKKHHSCAYQDLIRVSCLHMRDSQSATSQEEWTTRLQAGNHSQTVLSTAERRGEGVRLQHTDAGNATSPCVLLHALSYIILKSIQSATYRYFLAESLPTVIPCSLPTYIDVFVVYLPILLTLTVTITLYLSCFC